MIQNITYRDDQIVVIFKNCNSLQELNKAANQLGYLNVLGVQDYRPVVATLHNLRFNELKNRIKK